MKAFQIKVGGKLLDYRFGQKVDLEAFSKHIEQKGYSVEKIWSEKRHAVGVLKKNEQKLFIKLATSAGMSRLSENEFEWNRQFNRLNPRAESNFWVPQNFDSGYFENLFYLITDFGDGEKISIHEPNSQNYLEQTIDGVISFSELIQTLKLTNLNPNELSQNLSAQEWFLEKTRSWLEGIPQDVTKQYKIERLMELVEEGANKLKSSPRHGDFTPWHIFKLSNGKLYLFDAEQSLSEGVEYYDIAYYIQRVFSILQNKSIAEKFLNELKDRGYDFKKVKILLAARGIGGFHDKYLGINENGDYKIDERFADLVRSL